MRMTAHGVAEAVGGRVAGAGDILLTGAEVDSRRVQPGHLFVALPGAHQDGHEFVGEALQVADGALVCDDAAVPRVPPGKAYVRVPQPLNAYHLLASLERRTRRWSVIGLTGSVGKTTTKEILRVLLGSRFSVGASEGNRNSTLGLPAQLLSQPPSVDLFVAELGMSRAGELDLLGHITRPDIILYTRIAPVHTEFFDDFSALVTAKAELLPHLAEGGTLILNADDRHQSRFGEMTTESVVLYGRSGAVTARKVESLGLAGSRLVLEGAGAPITIELPLAGPHQVENFVAAAAAASCLGVSAENIATAAADLQAPARRGMVHRLVGGVTIVDDSYNASPVAVDSMLHLLAATPGRRVAVLGEMLELGKLAGTAHVEIGRHAAERADILVTVGHESAAIMAEAARNAGLSTASARHVGHVDDAIALVGRLLKPGDVVLVKGSRGVALDRLVDSLVGNEGGG